ncbi:ent-cassadiene hydroxylase-like [Oryza glaberrima]|uniref:Cytochrome P450 n=2 Tax=Oryza TaxID=4527 RepID=A0A0D3GNP4_9ORYZ|nr:ent-cassadiene hydroxylase-like [Oryza glaberrima]
MGDMVLLATRPGVVCHRHRLPVISCAANTKPPSRLKLPPGPSTLPLIGSIHHFVPSSESVHGAMRRLAREHGPVMQLWFGEVPTVVASSPEAAQEVLRSKDLAFADRHMTSATAAFSFGGRDVALAPYGERWRHLRRLLTQELLTAARVRSFRRVREEEVARLVRDVSAAAASGGTTVNLTEMAAKLINDIVLRCSVGSRSKYSDEYLAALHAMVVQSFSLSVADLFPSSKLASMVAMAPRRALANRKKMERIIEQIIQERKDQMETDTGDQAAAAERKSCSLDDLLRLQKEGGGTMPITNDVIIVLLMDMFAAGTDTSSTTLIWTMAELIRSPRVMAKAQAEVRQAFEGKNTITEDDLTQLSYLKMVIKESLRLHCPVPLLAPRKCRETCTIMGYDVPKGTSVFVNVWAICRDSKYWEDAEEFKPERFENNNIEYKGSNFEFLPFGSGHRICPGINLGLANMEFALANLLYHFDWKLSNGMLHKDLDMREAPGLIAAKHTSLNVCPVTHIAPSCS